MRRRTRVMPGVVLLAALVAAGATGCSLVGGVFGKEDLDSPTGRCVVLNREYDRPVLTPVEPVVADAGAATGADTGVEAPALPARRVGAVRLDELAAGPATRAGAEAYALAWATHALDSRDMGDLQPLLQRHGPRLPGGQVAALVKSHCDAWVSAGERRLDHDRPVWVRSAVTDDGRQVQVELAGTVTWRSHLYPVQDLSMRIDVERGDDGSDGWRLTTVQGPRATPTTHPLRPRVGPPAGDGWRRATG